MICIHNLGHMNQNIHPVGLVVPTPIWNRIDLMDDSIETIWYSASFAWRQMIPSGVCGAKRCPNKTNPLRLQAVNRVDGLVQDCSIFSTLAMEIMHSCTKLSMWWVQNKWYMELRAIVNWYTSNILVITMAWYLSYLPFPNVCKPMCRVYIWITLW